MTDLLSQSFRLPDGRTLMYAEYGAPNGKPVFYFHGHAGSRLEPAILDNNDFVQAGIRLIACDRPGMGGSDFQPGRGFSHWPADIVSLAGGMGLDKFGVWGVSGGGGYVSACARLIPDRLSAAVIVSGAGYMNSPEARASLPVMARLMWGVAARSVRLMSLFLNLTKPRNLGDPAKVRQQMLRTMPPAERAFFETPGRLEAFMASGMESMRQGVHGVAWDACLYARPWDFRLEEICFPVRLLHGEADRNVPVAVARQVAAVIPGCQAAFYPGEGHISVLANHVDEVLISLTTGAPRA
ncbi:MAG: alpha/beta hydrolase [Chloroflexi bacterium]|nr:alpha/beta hydrolase [Chloroflexota bacterium]